jgi:hypothetical protein
MKAENSRKALGYSNLYNEGLAIDDKWYKECIVELKELERLAKLGAAYLKWCELTGKMHRAGDNVVIPFEEELLEWAEG